MRSSKSIGTLGAIACAAVLMAAASAEAQQQQLTIASAGGAWQQAQHNAWYVPFAQKMGIKFNEEETSAGMARVEAMVKAGNVTDDVVTVDTAQVLAACDTGVLVRLDWSKVAPRDGFLPGAARDCGMGLDVYGDILAYNTDVVKSDPPTSVLALFDTKRWPGKRGMQKIAPNNLEWALEADGVPPDQVYKVLATPQGVDRAFAKLDTIKKDIVWWQAGAQPPQLLASHEVVMTTAWNGRIQNPIDHDHAPFKIVWGNEIIEYDMISIPKGSPNLELAYKYLAYVAEPENNARLGQFIPYGPVVKDAVKFVPAETLPKLPTAPDHMTNALPIDMEFWADYGQDLNKRFNDWLAK
jgi:putative spermidine/putrescine transport system substrate-binding protein